MEATYVADSEARLRSDLEDKGLHLLRIDRLDGLAGFRVPGLALQSRASRGRVKTAEFLVFNQELATLLKAGMPLVQSLDILRQRVPNPAFKVVLDDVYERVRGGSSLSDAFEAQAVFPGVYVASLMAGEKSGSLELVIRRYVHHVRVVSAVKKKTVSALIYPAILLSLSIVVVSIIVFKVIPEFGTFYEQFGSNVQLPFLTRVMVGFAEAAVRNIAIIVSLMAAAAIGVTVLLNRPGMRAQLDGLLLRLPFFGGVARRFSVSQVARTIATLLGGGIPLVAAIETSSRAIGNRQVAGELIEVAQQVREGRSMAAALSERGTFPDVALKMVEVGESTGALQDMLTSVADFYDEENETALGRFVTIIEPALLVVMGLVIAVLLLSLYMPLFELSSAVRS
ncbi:MAG: type II secretion system F family protein [Acidobacteriota bacterium]|nr:type II secretion system F family protein [Acidobacteriota bacterium]